MEKWMRRARGPKVPGSHRTYYYAPCTTIHWLQCHARGRSKAWRGMDHFLELSNGASDRRVLARDSVAVYIILARKQRELGGPSGVPGQNTRRLHKGLVHARGHRGAARAYDATQNWT